MTQISWYAIKQAKKQTNAETICFKDDVNIKKINDDEIDSVW